MGQNQEDNINVETNRTSNDPVKKVGRPAVMVNWPNSPFTCDDALAFNNGKVKEASMRHKINLALKNNVLAVIGKHTGKGAPKIIYSVKGS